MTLCTSSDSHTCSFAQPFSGKNVFSFVPAPADRPIPEVNLTSNAVPASCATTITPACLQALYGIPTALATQKANTLGVSGFIDQFANQADLRVSLPSVAHAIRGPYTMRYRLS